MLYSIVQYSIEYSSSVHCRVLCLSLQVGDVSSDHSCWMRPEDMTTLRTSYKVGGTKCGSDVAGETAAAMAAASIVFKSVNATYSAILLQHAKDLFTFATTCLGAYSDTIPEVNPYYTSYSGFKVRYSLVL